MIMRSIFTQASVQLHFLCFCFHSVILVFFSFVFFFFWLSSPLPLRNNIITHTSGVTSHYIVLHPVSSSVFLGLPAYAFSIFTILGLSTIAISDSILAKDVTLDCSKACICFVHRSRHIYFTSWLNNIDEFRCSTAEIASITTMFWTLSSVCRLLVSSSLV